MTNLPVRGDSQRFDVAVYTERSVKASVVPLLLNKEEDWPAFAVALRALWLQNSGNIRDAISSNPEGALVALVKCARLGLSLNPADKHFALTAYRVKESDGGGYTIEGAPMYQGYQHLVMTRSDVEWLQADVVYKQEYRETGGPLIDPKTQWVNHVPNVVERANYKDDDVVGAYCMAKRRGTDRLVTTFLDRRNLNKRRASAKTDKMWSAWFREMCVGKAIKACCSSGRIPLDRTLLHALRDADDEPETAALPTAPSSPAALPAPPARPQTADGFLLGEADKEPLPDDPDLHARLVKAVDMRAIELELPDDALVAQVKEIVGVEACKDVAALTTDELKTLLDKLHRVEP